MGSRQRGMAPNSNNTEGGKETHYDYTTLMANSMLRDFIRSEPGRIGLLHYLSSEIHRLEILIENQARLSDNNASLIRSKLEGIEAHNRDIRKLLFPIRLTWRFVRLFGQMTKRIFVRNRSR